MRKYTYLGSFPLYAIKNVDPIYLVASYQYSKQIDDNRTWGWFPKLRQACKAVEMNAGDMHEGSYNYVIIERVYPGVCFHTEFIDAYEWQSKKIGRNRFNGKWVKCKDPPSWLNGVIGLTIG